MADELTEDAEGRLTDKDGVEHIPDSIRRVWWFRAILWAGLAWCLLSTMGLVYSGVTGKWWDFLGALGDCVISWLALLCAATGIVWED